MTAGPAVTAVVLSIGEPTTQRAVDSVVRQTRRVSEIVTIDGVTPFHRALNAGAARVTTPFFVQVDADMVLDAECLERLAACVAPRVGLVVGLLRDPLLGRIEAVKLCRTECAHRHPFGDSISPDTDFGAVIAREDWATVYALRYDSMPATHWHTFGDHDPSYTALYTYAKHTLEGRRLRYRRNAPGLHDQLRRLRRSTHPMALVAEIAVAHGLFLEGENDRLRPYAPDRDFLRLVEFLRSRDPRSPGEDAPTPRIALWPKSAFRRGYELGIALAAAGRADRFEQVLTGLRASRRPSAFIMRIGLCEGLFAERYDAAVLDAAWATVRALLPGVRRALLPAVPPVLRRALRRA